MVTIKDAVPLTEEKEYSLWSASTVMLNDEAALAGVKTITEANTREIAKNGRHCLLKDI